MHPYGGHKQHHVAKRRVKVLMRSGGLAHSDEAADKKLFKELMAKHEASESAHGGEHAKSRMDRRGRAEGGAVTPSWAKGPGYKTGSVDPKTLQPVNDLGTGQKIRTISTKASGGRVGRAHGGRVKHRPHVSVNIHTNPNPGMPLPPAAAGLAGPPIPPPAPGAGLPPPGMPPMMRKDGGRANYKSGISTKANLDKWASYAKHPVAGRAAGGRIRGGDNGIGRLDKAAIQKRSYSRAK